MMRLFVCLAALVAALFCYGVQGVTVVVPLHDQVCFHEDMLSGETATITYQVDEGDVLEIDFWVTSPKRTTMFIGKRDGTGQYDLAAPMDGRYQYCFSNKVNSKSERLVQFAIDKAPQLTSSKIKDAMTPVMELLQKLDFTMRTINSEQQYIIARERSHRRSTLRCALFISCYGNNHLACAIPVKCRGGKECQFHSGIGRRYVT